MNLFSRTKVLDQSKFFFNEKQISIVLIKRNNVRQTENSGSCNSDI